jgi:transposase
MIDPSCYGDLTDTEWSLIEPSVSEPPPTVLDHDLRLVVNGIFFLMRTGLPLRAAPPWSTAESYYSRWRADGTWEKIIAMRQASS